MTSGRSGAGPYRSIAPASVVAGEDAGAGPFVGRQRAVDRRDLFVTMETVLAIGQHVQQQSGHASKSRIAKSADRGESRVRRMASQPVGTGGD